MRELRRSRGLSLEVLSERSGVGVRTLSDIERGVSRTPLRRTVEAIGSGLELDPDEQAAFVRTVQGHRRSALVIARAPSISPHRLSDFSGRAVELDQIVSRLERAVDETTVVILSGPGGVGKTALAVEVVARRTDEQMRLFAHLEAFGPSPLTTLEILSRLLEQSGAPGQAPTSVDEAVSRWRDRSAEVRPLVVLDDAADEPQVLDVLAATAGGAVLITSRRRLAVPAALHVPLRVFSAAESDQLLRRIVPADLGSDDVLADLARLCGDLPLAIRIAGNRVVSRPNQRADDLVERMRPIRSRLSALVAGDLSVDAAFRLSFDELSDAESRLFTALGAIDGTTFEADLAAAAAGTDPADAEQLLIGLSDLGLVEVVGDTRFRLHDLIRLFAAARLRENGEPDRRRDAVRSWALAALSDAAECFRPDSERACTARTFRGTDDAAAWIRAEVDHWWPAYEDVIARGADEVLLELADRLFAAYRYRGWWWTRWTELFAEAAAAAARLGDARAEALHFNHLSCAEYDVRNDDAAGYAAAMHALDAAGRADDDVLSGWANLYASWSSLRGSGDRSTGLALASDAVDAFTRAGEHQGLVEARHVRGRFLRMLGEPAAALAEHESLLADLAAGGMRLLPENRAIAEIACLADIVEDLLALGSPDGAADRAAAAVRAAEFGTSPLSVVFALTQRARAHLAGHRWDSALQDIVRAEALLANHPDDRQRALLAELRGRLPAPP